ncbi:MAG: GNAT family N-acetyltransferase [Candidatus Bipolaricaulia bacterium]
MNLHTTVFDPHKASESEWVVLNTFQNRMRAEQWPDDPPREIKETIRNLCSLPPFVDLHFWVVWRVDGSEIVATANAVIWRTDHNKHLAQFDISVLPEMRRQRIAKRLLELVADVAHKENRRLLLASTDSVVPAGEAFMKRLGGHMGLAFHTNQLDLADLNRDLMRQWQERAQEQASGFELGVWEGPYPEEDLEAIVTMKEVMNTAPRDTLEVEDFKWTPEQLRQIEATLAQRKTERWTMYTRHVETGELAGYTEVLWNSNQPETLIQEDTGVFPEYRNRGLGRWLKSAMIEKILRDRSQVKRVRTGNATSNAAMLKINHEIGFKPYKSQSVWQVELDRVLEYLESK